MNQIPVRLREHALVLTPPREQQPIHLSLGPLSDIVEADPCPVRGVQHRGHALARHALRGRDGPPGQALGP